MSKISTKGVVISLAIAASLAGAYIYRDKLKSAAKSIAKDIIGYVFNKNQEYFLSDLNPKYQDRFRRFIADIEKLGYKALITSGYRSFDEQKELKAKNPKNASVGMSMHNYGLAIDLNLVSKKDGSQLRKADSTAAWEKTGVVALAKKYGLLWGGGKTFGGYHDPVHFSIPLKGSTLYAQAIRQFGSEDKVVGNRLNIA